MKAERKLVVPVGWMVERKDGSAHWIEDAGETKHRAITRFGAAWNLRAMRLVRVWKEMEHGK